LGYTAESCFQLIGYPNGGGERPKTDGKASGKTKMLHRSGAGRGKGASLKANVAQAHVIGCAVKLMTDADKYGLAGLTTYQWQKLVDMLNKGENNEKMTGICKFAS